MATVSHTVTLPDGTTPPSTGVSIRLLATDGTGVGPAYLTTTGEAIEGDLDFTVTTGSWSKDLALNADITPAGTVWRVIERVGGKAYTWTASVTGDGDLSDMLVDPPGALATAGSQAYTDGQLAAHEADTSGAHVAAGISVTPAGGISSTNVQAALEELDAATAAGAVTYVTGLATGAGAATANRTAIQAALDAAETAGGGTVLIPVGRFEIDGTLNLGSRVVLAGFGWGSILQLANTVASAASPVSMVKAKDNTNYVGVEDLLLDGNKANQTDTNYASHGVDFSRTGTESPGDTRYDGALRCRNVRVESCMGTGFLLHGSASTVRVTDCEAYHNDGDGFYFKTDCEIANCTSANNGLNGFNNYSGTSIRLTSCKGFGNGHRGTGNMGDFKFGYSNTIMLSDCQAEDSSESGFFFTACSHVTAIGCQAYRSGTHGGPDSLQTGFWIEDDGAGNLCHDFTLIGAVKGDGGAGSMKWALVTRNLGTDVFVQLTTEGLASGTWNHLSGSKSNSRVIFDGLEVFQENHQTGTSYEITLSDMNRLVVMDNAAANTLNVPAYGDVQFPDGATMTIEQRGAGQTTITPIPGVAVNVLSTKGLKLAGRHAVATLRKVTGNTWNLSGDLTA